MLAWALEVADAAVGRRGDAELLPEAALATEVTARRSGGGAKARYGCNPREKKAPAALRARASRTKRTGLESQTAALSLSHDVWPAPRLGRRHWAPPMRQTHRLTASAQSDPRAAGGTVHALLRHEPRGRCLGAWPARAGARAGCDPLSPGWRYIGQAGGSPWRIRSPWRRPSELPLMSASFGGKAEDQPAAQAPGCAAMTAGRGSREPSFRHPRGGSPSPDEQCEDQTLSDCTGRDPAADVDRLQLPMPAPCLFEACVQQRNWVPLSTVAPTAHGI